MAESSIPAHWWDKYPLSVGVPALVLGGGAAGVLFHLLRRNKAKKKPSFWLDAAAGLGLGTAAGGVQLAAHARGDVKKTFEDEMEAAKYDRQGPFRQLLRALRPFIPVREGKHELPYAVRFNPRTDAPRQPLTNLPDTVSFGTKIAPNDTRISVSSPPAEPEGFWRQGYEGGKPKLFFTLDKFLIDKFGKPKDSTSYTGSEVLGSKSQYDYNNAVGRALSPYIGEVFDVPPKVQDPPPRLRNRLKAEPGEPVTTAAAAAPLRASDISLVIEGHGSDKQLRSVAGVPYEDILKQLSDRGVMDRVNDLILQTCNTEGCDIPAMVQRGLGRVPTRLTYAPPGASGVRDNVDQHIFNMRRNNLVQKEISGKRPLGENARTAPRRDLLPKAQPAIYERLMDQAMLAPKRVTTVPVLPGTKGTLNVGVESPATQTLVAPLVSPKTTGMFANVIRTVLGPTDPAAAQAISDQLWTASQPVDYVFAGPAANSGPGRTGVNPDLLRTLQQAKPEWFPSPKAP